jgi:hypothetical protein
MIGGQRSLRVMSGRVMADPTRKIMRMVRVKAIKGVKLQGSIGESVCWMW